MKRIVDGKMYDTMKATQICRIKCSAAEEDFDWEETSLYCSRVGRYFLAGEGGPLSRWGQRDGDNALTRGGGILPLSLDEAIEIANDAGLTTDEMIAAGFAADKG